MFALPLDANPVTSNVLINRLAASISIIESKAEGEAGRTSRRLLLPIRDTSITRRAETPNREMTAKVRNTEMITTSVPISAVDMVPSIKDGPTLIGNRGSRP